MSLGSWDPKAGTNAATTGGSLELDTALLNRLIGYSSEDQLSQLEELFSSDEKQTLAGLMLIDHDKWKTACEPLADEDLLHLIRFFAVAENLPGWEAGATSPVIPLAKLLRKRGSRLDKPLLQWLREVNDNRFLPYGPL